MEDKLVGYCEEVLSVFENEREYQVLLTNEYGVSFVVS